MKWREKPDQSQLSAFQDLHDADALKKTILLFFSILLDVVRNVDMLVFPSMPQEVVLSPTMTHYVG